MNPDMVFLQVAFGIVVGWLTAVGSNQLVTTTMEWLDDSVRRPSGEDWFEALGLAAMVPGLSYLVVALWIAPGSPAITWLPFVGSVLLTAFYLLHRARMFRLPSGIPAWEPRRLCEPRVSSKDPSEVVLTSDPAGAKNRDPSQKREFFHRNGRAVELRRLSEEDADQELVEMAARLGATHIVKLNKNYAQAYRS